MVSTIIEMLNTFNKADGYEVRLISLKQNQTCLYDVSLTYSYVM
jgi:hypothetical protein